LHDRQFLVKSNQVDAPLDSTAGGRPNFLTTQWVIVSAASAEGAAEARAALEELYRFYCYPVYAFIRRRGHSRQDAQDLTQDFFFVHLLEKGTLGRADPKRGRFRSFLLGVLEHFLADAAKRAGAAKRGGGCQWVFLDDDSAEDRYRLAAPEGLTAEKLFDAQWAGALVEATFARLRCELERRGSKARDWRSSSRIGEPYWFWMAWSRSKIRLVHKKDAYVSLPSRRFCANSLPSMRGFA